MVVLRQDRLFSNGGGSMVLIVQSRLSADLLVIASAKRVNIPDVQNVLLSWFLDKNGLKSAILISKLYQVNKHWCS